MPLKSKCCRLLVYIILWVLLIKYFLIFFLFLFADHMTISVLELGIAVVNQPANRRRTKCSCSFSKYIWDRENDNFFFTLNSMLTKDVCKTIRLFQKIYVKSFEVSPFLWPFFLFWANCKYLVLYKGRVIELYLCGTCVLLSWTWPLGLVLSQFLLVYFFALIGMGWIHSLCYIETILSSVFKYFFFLLEITLTINSRVFLSMLNHTVC